MSQAVLLDIGRGVATLTLNQPDNRNAMTSALLDGLGDGLESAIADNAVRVIVLTNEGTTFSAGADLKGGGLAPSRFGLPRILGLILDSPKPVLGRIAGHCMGGGVGLAAACDISVARSDVKFGFTEVRIGAAPAIISVVCLAKMRRGDALELFLSGERISAERARQVGLINSVVEPEGFDEELESLAAKVMAGAPGALAASKRLVFDVSGVDRDTAFARTAEISRELFGSAEALEGMAAFREKRPASWVPE
jgi:methylglutaconyl-CoA hydratase